MYENDYMYAIERNDQYLAHYGVRGMKWGVRKAIAKGDGARLSRQYAKAQKKLAKLEKRAGNSKKYARRAALMGAGAAAAGGLAAAGTGGVARGVAKASLHAANASRSVGNAMVRTGQAVSRIPGANKFAGRMIGAGYGLQAKGATGKYAGSIVRGGAGLSKTINDWGNGKSAVGQSLKIAGRQFQNNNGALVAKVTGGKGIVNTTDKLGNLSRNTVARIGAGAVGAGLAAGAARNAYKAATAKRKAEKFRSAMNEAFKGTQYANGGRPRQGKKRNRR